MQILKGAILNALDKESILGAIEYAEEINKFAPDIDKDLVIKCAEHRLLIFENRGLTPHTRACKMLVGKVTQPVNRPEHETVLPLSTECESYSSEARIELNPEQACVLTESISEENSSPKVFSNSQAEEQGKLEIFFSSAYRIAYRVCATCIYSTIQQCLRGLWLVVSVKEKKGA